MTYYTNFCAYRIAWKDKLNLSVQPQVSFNVNTNISIIAKTKVMIDKYPTLLAIIKAGPMSGAWQSLWRIPNINWGTNHWSQNAMPMKSINQN